MDGQDDLLRPLLVFYHKSGVAEVVFPSQGKRMQVLYDTLYNPLADGASRRSASLILQVKGQWPA